MMNNNNNYYNGYPNRHSAQNGGNPNNGSGMAKGNAAQNRGSSVNGRAMQNRSGMANGNIQNGSIPPFQRTNPQSRNSPHGQSQNRNSYGNGNMYIPNNEQNGRGIPKSSVYVNGRNVPLSGQKSAASKQLHNPPKKKAFKFSFPKITLPKKLRSPKRYPESGKKTLRETFEPLRRFFGNERHSSLSALIALVIVFAGIVTAVSIGASRQFERVVIEVAPSFTYEYSKLLLDAPSPAMDQVDMSGYSQTLAAEIYSEAAILMDLGSGIIIAEKNADLKVFPASLTKIMTAVLAIEHLTNLDEKYMFTDQIFINLRGQNASTAGFEAWETVTYRDLIYGVMLPSGAEASVAVAELIAGSELGFADVMNEKAAELGMTGTHFVNCTGLHSDDHYTTVSDLTRLLDYALQNDLFREVFTARTYTTSRTKYHPTGLTFESTVFRYIRAEGQAKNNKFIIGGKTGFTTEGRQCLATIANDGEFDYILVTTGAGDGVQTPRYNVLDALYLYDRYLTLKTD